ncbi:hypothetical protein [Sphingopyxis flava]|nr:hypothetical protein [Sphingopyxis flava]
MTSEVQAHFPLARLMLVAAMGRAFGNEDQGSAAGKLRKSGFVEARES